MYIASHRISFAQESPGVEAHHTKIHVPKVVWVPSSSPRGFSFPPGRVSSQSRFLGTGCRQRSLNVHLSRHELLVVFTLCTNALHGHYMTIDAKLGV